jgi:uncharacterized protein YhaN
MTSTELQAQLDQLNQEIDGYQKRLKLPQPDMHDAINAEMELAARQSVLVRLERQLTDALAKEKTFQEKEIKAELETELAELELQFQELNGELNQEVRETANNLVSALSRCLAIRSRLGPIVKEHEDTYMELNGKYPERSLGYFGWGMRVKADEQSNALSVADIALMIIEHESFNGEFQLDNWLAGINQVVTAMSRIRNSYVPVQPEPISSPVDMNDPFFNEFQS